MQWNLHCIIACRSVIINWIIVVEKIVRIARTITNTEEDAEMASTESSHANHILSIRRPMKT